MKWFRLYTEIIDDPKLYGLTHEQRYRMILLMCLACDLELEGRINLDLQKIAYRVRVDVRAIRSLIDKLCSLDILSKNGDSGDKGVTFINWNKRQFRSDNVIERVRKHRLEKVTRNVTKSLYETAPETETETETEKESLKSPSGVDKSTTSKTIKRDSEEKKPIVSDNKHFTKNLSQETIDKANAVCKQIACKDFNPFEWIQVQKRRGFEFEEIIGVIERSESYLDRSKNRWSYLEAVMKTEGAEIRARRKISEDEVKLKVPFNEIVGILKKELGKGG